MSGGRPSPCPSPEDGTRDRAAAAVSVVHAGMDTDLLMVGVGLAALMVGLFGWLRTDISRLDRRVDGLRQDMLQANDSLRQEMLQANDSLRQEMLQANDGLRGEIDGLRQETRQANDSLRGEIVELRESMDRRLRTVEYGQAKLEGLLEGLREAISGRNAA